MRSVLPMIVAAALVGSACQPKDVRPGFWLRGESAEGRVGDWRFTGGVDEIFIETRSRYGIPHSTTIWCVELEGELYVGSYGDAKKRWEKNIARDPRARLRVEGRIYAVNLMPVTNRALAEALDAAYAQKYDMVDVFGEEVPEWWYYRVEERGSGAMAP